MHERSVFFEEWLRSLREQYKHVLRQADRVTLSSLTDVMLEVGFDEDELARLRVEATMHVDDVGADYVADMHILEPAPPVETESSHPASAATDEPTPASDGPTPSASGTAVEQAESNEANEDDEEPAPMTFEDSLAAQESAQSEAIDDAINDDDSEDDDKPQQISLF